MNVVPSTPQTTTQSISSLLATVATVAAVRTSSLGLTRTDKRASAESDSNHHARQGTGKVLVSRLAGAEDRIKSIRQLQQLARDTLTNHTTAWGDRRLLPNVNINSFLRQWGEVKKEFDIQVTQLRHDASNLIRQAERNMGDYEVELPTEEEISEAFTLDFTMEQVPDAANFKTTGLDAEVEAELKRRFEANMQAAYAQAQNDAVERVKLPLKNLVERMAAYQKREDSKANGIDVGREGYFRDTIIENINQIGQVFGSFNLTDDPLFERIAKELEAFDGIEADDLRNSQALRDDTAKRAQKILDSLGDWM